MANGKTAYEKQVGVHLRQTRQGCVNLATRCFLESSWEVYHVRREDGEAICQARAAKTSRTCEPPMFIKRLKHQEVAQEGRLLFPCADGRLKLFDLPQPPRGEMPARGNPEQGEKKKRAPFSNKITVKTCGT